METESKGEENYNPVSINELKLEIQDELKNIKQVQKLLARLSKKNKVIQSLDYSKRIRNKIFSEFIRKNYTQKARILNQDVTITENLVSIFEENIKNSDIFRNEIKRLNIETVHDSIDSINTLLDDFSKMNGIFGPSNENGEKCIKEISKTLLKQYNNPKEGKYQALKNNYYSDNLNKFLSQLDSNEVESYIRVLLTKCGVHGITSTHTAENYLKAFIKLNFEKDKIRRFWNTSENNQKHQEVLIKALKGKYSSSNGFDEIVLSVFGKGKSTKYSLKTVEMKVGDDLSGFFDYIRINKNIKFTSQISNDIDAFLTIPLKQLIRNNIDFERANDIIVELNNKYKFTTSGIGYDFNVKIKSSNLRNSLIDSGLSLVTINKILEGSIKQNQLISLIQHGIAHKMVREKGFFTTIDETVHQVNFKTNIGKNNDDKFINIEIHRDVFLPKFVLRKDGSLILKIEGFDSILRAMENEGKQSSEEYKAYSKLNGILKDVLSNFYRCEINNEVSRDEVSRNLNDIHRLIYFELMKHCNNGLFEELSIFDCGMMFHCLETISNLGQKTDEKLLKYFNSKSVVPYAFHQHWETPYSLENSFKLTGINIDNSTLGGWIMLKEKYMGKLLPKDIVVVVNEKNIWSKFEDDSNWFQKILRDLEPPYKIPDGFNLNHYANIVRPLIFYDKESMKPVSVKGYNHRRQWLGIKIDMNKFFEEKSSFSKNLFQFPIKINVRGVEFSQSNEIVDTWKKRLIYSGIPEEQVNLLGTQYNFRNTEGYFNIKILFAIIFEYKHIWRNFTTWIQKYIQSIDNWANFLPSSVNPEYGFRFRIVDEQVQFDYTGRGDWKDVLLGIGSKMGEGTWNVRKDIKRTFVFPAQNNLFNKLIDDIEFHIWKIILDSPQDKPVGETWSFIISNWKDI